eukprot:3030217-Rhodomonas_salina.1
MRMEEEAEVKGERERRVGRAGERERGRREGKRGRGEVGKKGRGEEGEREEEREEERERRRERHRRREGWSAAESTACMGEASRMRVLLMQCRGRCVRFGGCKSQSPRTRLMQRLQRMGLSGDERRGGGAQGGGCAA